jgi:phage terminase small subunit
MKTAAPNSNKTKKPKKRGISRAKSQKNPQESPKHRPLSRKQQIFVSEYLIDLNGTQAAIRAGYSKEYANRCAVQLLSNIVIKEAVDREIEARKARNIISADEILQMVADLIRSDMADFVEIDEGGAIRALPLDGLAEGRSKLIKKVKEKRTIKSTAEGDQVLESTYEFELHDKIKPIELGMRHLGMLVEKQEIDLKQPINLTIKKFYRKPAAPVPKEQE